MALAVRVVPTGLGDYNLAAGTSGSVCRLVRCGDVRLDEMVGRKSGRSIQRMAEHDSVARVRVIPVVAGMRLLATRNERRREEASNGADMSSVCRRDSPFLTLVPSSGPHPCAVAVAPIPRGSKKVWEGRKLQRRGDSPFPRSRQRGCPVAERRFRSSSSCGSSSRRKARR